jgi:parallel beta helix pectate lyase-like protein
MAARVLRGLLGLALLAAGLVMGCGQAAPPRTPPHGLGPSPMVRCDLYAAPDGSNSAPGSRSRPLATAGRLVNALHRGQTGCFRGGVYSFSLLELATPGVTLAPYQREKVTLRGEVKVLPGGVRSTIEGLSLIGTGGSSDIGPRIYADGVVLRGNEITNQHTGICILISNYYSGPPPRGVVIERNRIHDCGALPPTNHNHGIYVAHAIGTVIRDNWIYDNADRGIQLYPDAQRTKIVGNVIDSNGEGIVFSGDGSEVSSNNIVEGNIISNSRVRWNVYSGAPGPTAKGNVVRDNCLWAGDSRPSYESGGGVEAPSRNFSANSNVVVDPSYSDPAAGDYWPSSESKCPLLGHAGNPAFTAPRG